MPFQAVKNWALNNVENDDVLLYESTGSDDGDPMALEYVDYGDGISTPYTSSDCLIALEQQEADRVNHRYGLKLSGPFYDDADPVNVDGTYKRSVYYQVRASFYNTYRDQTKLFGMENIDFEVGKTKRRISDKISLFDVPRNVYGDKIIPSTVVIRDTSLDNDYTIEDDGYGNLVARRNLFSKQQEIGEFTNEFVVGDNHNCDDYFGVSGSVPFVYYGDDFETYDTGSAGTMDDGTGFSGSWVFGDG